MRSAFDCKHGAKLEERFWCYVNKTGTDDCWPWSLALSNDGYGQFCAGGWTVGAHRYAYECEYGEIVGGSIVIHSCKNLGCCNPRHLLVAKHGDGKVLRGTVARGERSGRTKLTRDDVHLVRMRFDAGESPTVIGRDFDISRRAVVLIGERRNWAWLEELVEFNLDVEVEVEVEVKLAVEPEPEPKEFNPAPKIDKREALKPREPGFGEDSREYLGGVWVV